MFSNNNLSKNDKQKKINWHKNKIKGGFAEEVCKSHFQYLNFDVTPSGIENIAPQYASYCNRIEEKNNKIRKVLNKMPDLLVSNSSKAFLVEVKFRSDIKMPEDFYLLGEELLYEYRYMLFRCNRLSSIENKKQFFKELKGLPKGTMEEELCENFIFYVVLSEPDQYFNSYVHIFIPKNYKTTDNGKGWRNGKSEKINNILKIDNFSIGYHEIVKPLLDEFFNTHEKYKILSVSIKDAKIYDSNWTGKMQEIKTNKGIFIDNIVGKTHYGIIGYNWTNEIDKEVYATVNYLQNCYWLQLNVIKY